MRKKSATILKPLGDELFRKKKTCSGICNWLGFFHFHFSFSDTRKKKMDYLNKMEDAVAKGNYLFRTEHERVVAEHTCVRLPQADPKLESAISLLENRQDAQDSCMLGIKTRVFPTTFSPRFGDDTPAEERRYLMKCYAYFTAQTRRSLSGFAFDVMRTYDPMVRCVTVHFDFVTDAESRNSTMRFCVNGLVPNHLSPDELVTKYCIGNGSAGYFMAEEDDLDMAGLSEYEKMELLESDAQQPLLPTFRLYSALEAAFTFFAKAVYCQIGMMRERWVSTTIPRGLRTIANGVTMPLVFEAALVAEGFFSSVQVIHSAVEDWLRSR